MAIIETKDLVFDYIRRDEEGNVEESPHWPSILMPFFTLQRELSL